MRSSSAKNSSPSRQAMPLPPFSPNLSIVSAMPSPSSSRSAMIPPISAPSRELAIATNTSPDGVTVMCRAMPTSSANTDAQNPSGSAIEPLSASHMALPPSPPSPLSPESPVSPESPLSPTPSSSSSSPQAAVAADKISNTL